MKLFQIIAFLFFSLLGFNQYVQSNSSQFLTMIYAFLAFTYLLSLIGIVKLRGAGYATLAKEKICQKR